MKRGSECKPVDLVDLFFQEITDGLVSHYVVEHFCENEFVIVRGVSGIDASNAENLACCPGHIVVIEEFETVARAVLNDDLLSKADHVGQSESIAGAVACDDIGLGPVEGNVDLKFPSKDDDCIVAKHLPILFRIPVEKDGLGVKDGVLGRGGAIVGY